MSINMPELALELIVELLMKMVNKITTTLNIPYIKTFKIKVQIQSAVVTIVEPLLPFLSKEGISDENQINLIKTIVSELTPLVEKPALLFSGSLNGQKIFDKLYENRQYPEIIKEYDLIGIYSLICPRIADLLCRVPSTIKEWESLSWVENFHRFDEIANQLRTLFLKVDGITSGASKSSDEILHRIRQYQLQKIGLEMDITGLRGDQPYKGRISDFFVHPIISEIIEDNSSGERMIDNVSSALAFFISPGKKFILWGVAGSGKSTWTKWFEREVCNSESLGLAIRVELRNYCGSTLPSIQNLVRSFAGKHFAELITAPIINRWLENNQIVFIFDGYDEVASAERDVFMDWIIGLSKESRDCPMVITSRPLTTSQLENKELNLMKWEIKPFDIKRITQYIDNWYKHVSLLRDSERNIDPIILANQWQRDPTLIELTGNPLLLSTLLMVHHLDGSLPSGRSKLYQRYINGMLGIWDDRRNLQKSSVRLTPDQRHIVLKGLALHMFLNNRDQLEESYVAEWLKSFLEKNSVAARVVDVLDELCERTGLLFGPGIYTFAHKSIAEFLVSEVIWEGDYFDSSGQHIDRLFLLKQKDQDKWNSVIFLWAGLASTSDLTIFIEDCLEKQDWPLAYGLFLDQYDRLVNVETKRRILMPKLPIKINDISKKDIANLILSDGSPSCFDLFHELVSFQLRGLIRAFYSNLIIKAIKDDTICLSDINSESMYDFSVHVFNLFFYKFFDDISVLRPYKEVKLNSVKNKYRWSLITINQILCLAVSASKDLSEIIRVLLDEYEGFDKYFVFCIFSALYFSLVMIELRNRPKNELYFMLCSLSKAIPLLENIEVDQTWLKCSAKWSYKFAPPPIDSDPLDLLKMTKHELQKLVHTEEFMQHIKLINSYIDKLIKQRKVLMQTDK